MSTCRHKMSRFRMKVDMSQFFNDERSLVYCLVDPSWEQVINLEKHLEKLFDVQGVNFLAEDGIYIPSMESIDIIRSGEVLRAIIPQQTKTHKKIKPRPCNGFGDEGMAGDSISGHGVKRKCDEERLSTSTPNGRSRKKQRTSENVTTVPENSLTDPSVTAVVSSNAQQSVKNNASDIVTSSNTTNRVENVEIDEESEANEETVKSRKRKRLRKKKKTDDALDFDDKSTRLSSVPVPISSSTLRLSKSMSTPSRSKHVHFDESSTLVEKSSEVVVYRCQLSNDGTIEPREIAGEGIEDAINRPKKSKILIQENILLAKARHSPIEQKRFNDSSVIEVEDSAIRLETDEQQIATESAVGLSGINVENILPLSEPLVDLPDVDDIVLFKLYRLTEAMTPGISDYICCRCEQVDSTKKTIDCLVLDGLDQIDETHQRLNLSNGVRIRFSLDELLDKRIFRM